VRGDADRLVDHDDVAVGVHDGEPGDRLGGGGRRGGRGGHLHLQPGPGEHPVGAAAGGPVHGDAAAVDQRRGGGAGEAEQPGQRGVQP
jgi:hypothetical protein